MATTTTTALSQARVNPQLKTYGVRQVSSSSFGIATEFIPFRDQLFYLTDRNNFVRINNYTDPNLNATDLIQALPGTVQDTLILRNRMFLTVLNETTQNRTLWRTDGTIEGTAVYLPGRDVELLTVYKERIYFSASSPNAPNTNIYYTDGGNTPTNMGTKYDYLGLFIQMGEDLLYFSMIDTNVDPTIRPTIPLFRDVGRQLQLFTNPFGAILPIPGSPFIPFFDMGVNRTVYFFVAMDLDRQALYVTDGTPPGTQILQPMVSVLEPPPNNDDVKFPLWGVLGDTFFFTGAVDTTGDHRLWKTTGLTSATSLVDAGRPFPIDVRDPGEIFVFQNKLYYSATVENLGRELIVSDTMSTTTDIVVDIAYDSENPDQPSSFPKQFTEFNEKIFFWASGSGERDNYELYATDTTRDGTELVQSFQESSAMFVLGDEMYLTGSVEAGAEPSLFRLDAATEMPTGSPVTQEPTRATSVPTQSPTVTTSAPTGTPSMIPTKMPTTMPITVQPTMAPITNNPTGAPISPTLAPVNPTPAPVNPTPAPVIETVAPVATATSAPVAATSAPIDPTPDATAAPVNTAPTPVNPTPAPVNPAQNPANPTATPAPSGGTARSQEQNDSSAQLSWVTTSSVMVILLASIIPAIV